QMILRLEYVCHAPIAVEQPDPPNRPASAVLRQLVDVTREVRTMEAADAEVQDARREDAAIVVRHTHAKRLDRPEVRGCEPQRHSSEATTQSLHVFAARTPERGRT